MQPIYIAGYSQGLTNNKKPFLIPDQAFSKLENAYVWRERVKKREGLKLLGRLRRILAAFTEPNPDGTNLYQVDLLASVRATEPNAEIEVGTLVFTLDFGLLNTTIYEDDALNPGIITLVSGPFIITSGSINYVTGILTLNFDPAGIPGPGIPAQADFNYFPSLPVMGIWQRERSILNDEQTIFFDQKYSYIFSGSGFQQFGAGTTWAGSDSDFFWATNYRGSTPESRLLFATNFVNDAADPIRYTDGSTWTSFFPLVDATNSLFQARILLPYYGRLIALNVWEGATVGTAVNIFNRCRFSQVGSPIAVDAWISDQFGKGGFIDAPTSEQIVSAALFKNTLIVFFERSTWQLRYVGEYGIPFIWERVSSDFGSESTFSSVLFDDGVLSVGDRAIIASSAVNVDRVDLQIPDQVFKILNRDNGVKRVQGIRNFQKEVVYWSYPDFETLEDQTSSQEYFPNRVLVFNYRNNTYSIFDDSVTAFGTYQPAENLVTWDSLDVLWNSEDVTWDEVEVQSQFPEVVSGNQQGFVHFYAFQLPDEASLSVTDITLFIQPIFLTIPNHNLQTQDIIYLSGLNFLNADQTAVESTDLNDKTYQVTYIDNDTVSIMRWDTSSEPHHYISNFSFTPDPSAVYVGGGKVTVFPRLHVETKDFNPYQDKGGQAKLCYVDFLTDATPSASMSVTLFANSSPAVIGNLLVGNKEVPTYLTLPYYVPASEYAWHRFYATMASQYFRILMTYDDDLMNIVETHSQDWVLNAITLWVRPGGKLVF